MLQPRVYLACHKHCLRILLCNSSHPNNTGLIMHSCAGRIMNHLNVLPGTRTEVEDIEDFRGNDQTVTQFHQHRSLMMDIFQIESCLIYLKCSTWERKQPPRHLNYWTLAPLLEKCLKNVNQASWIKTLSIISHWIVHLTSYASLGHW